MKKIVKKILFIVILLAIPFILISTNVYADIDPNAYTPNGSIDENIVTTYGGSLYNILTIIGIIVSVIALMILGLKFILASTTEKAEYKKYLLPVVIGIFIIAFIISIVGLLGNIGGSMNDDAKSTIQNKQQNHVVKDTMDYVHNKTKNGFNFKK